MQHGVVVFTLWGLHDGLAASPSFPPKAEGHCVAPHAAASLFVLSVGWV
jgi:hypothetical protein